MVPALLVIFQIKEMDAAEAIHFAVGTSLAIMILNSASAVFAHQRRGNIWWKLFNKILIGTAIGAVIGVVIAGLIPGRALHLIFACVVLLIAIQIGFDLRPKGEHEMPHRWTLAGAGGIIGTISSLLGMGGGTFMVPYLNWCRVPMINAVATGSALTLPVAIIGSIGFAIIGWKVPMPYSTGYIHWPAFGGCVIGSIPLAPLGAHFARHLKPRALQIGFSIMLLVVAIWMFIG